MKGKGWHGDSYKHSMAARGISLKAEARKKKRFQSFEKFIKLDSDTENQIRRTMKDVFGSSFSTITFVDTTVDRGFRKNFASLTLKENTKPGKPETTLFAFEKIPTKINSFKAEKLGTAKRVEGVMGIGEQAKRFGAFVKYKGSFQVKSTIFSRYDIVFYKKITQIEKDEINQKFPLNKL